jgi:hypothetical protein
VTALENVVAGAEDAVRRLAGATGSCSMSMQHLNGRELWTVHAHVNGASIQGQGSDLPAALSKLRTVRLSVAA